MTLKLFTRKQKSSGDAAEDAALAYLKKQGLTLVCRNYRCKTGEIDLILNHAETLVFVEVRMRKSDAFGSAVETVTKSKQKKVVSAAQTYLLEKGHSANMPLRFDVVGIDGHEMSWIQAAF